MDNEKLVKSIKELCQKNNISISQLERELEFSPALISRWKDKNPNLDRIVDIADHFHVSIDEVIGRDGNNINDDFLKVLYKRTSNKEILWKTFNEKSKAVGIMKFCYNYDIENFKSSEEYEDFEETHKQKSYYFEYNKGYISMYALYEYHNITSPKELKLFIQPDIKAELIPQMYEFNELLPVWLKILTTLNDNAPDEIKAEMLKSIFVNEQIEDCVKNVENYIEEQESNEIIEGEGIYTTKEVVEYYEKVKQQLLEEKAQMES